MESMRAELRRGVIHFNECNPCLHDLISSDCVEYDYEIKLRELLPDKRIEDIKGISEAQDAQCEITLVGAWKQVEKKCDHCLSCYYEWEIDKNNLYYSFAAILNSRMCLEVVWSKYAKRCSICSPCYPGCGDLTTDGSLETYAISPNLVEDKYIEGIYLVCP